MSTRWVERYLGVPFVANGNTLAGCGCFGLVRIVMAEQAGIILDQRGELSGGALRELSRGRVPPAPDIWQRLDEVETARKFDLVVMTGRPFHIGIVVASRTVLHVEADSDSVMVAIDHPSIRDRILGVYRHRGLA